MMFPLPTSRPDGSQGTYPLKLTQTFQYSLQSQSVSNIPPFRLPPNLPFPLPMPTTFSQTSSPTPPFILVPGPLLQQGLSLASSLGLQPSVSLNQSSQLSLGTLQTLSTGPSQSPPPVSAHRTSPSKSRSPIRGPRPAFGRSPPPQGALSLPFPHNFPSTDIPTTFINPVPTDQAKTETITVVRETTCHVTMSRGFPLPVTPYGVVGREALLKSTDRDTLLDGSKKEFMITRTEKVSLWRTFAAVFHEKNTKLEVTDNSLLAIFLGLPSHIRRAVRHKGGIGAFLRECPWFLVRGDLVELVPEMEKLYLSQEDDMKAACNEEDGDGDNVPDSWEELSLSDIDEGGYTCLPSEADSDCNQSFTETPGGQSTGGGSLHSSPIDHRQEKRVPSFGQRTKYRKEVRELKNGGIVTELKWDNESREFVPSSARRRPTTRTRPPAEVCEVWDEYDDEEVSDVLANMEASRISSTPKKRFIEQAKGSYDVNSIAQKSTQNSAGIKPVVTEEEWVFVNDGVKFVPLVNNVSGKKGITPTAKSPSCDVLSSRAENSSRSCGREGTAVTEKQTSPGIPERPSSCPPCMRSPRSSSPVRFPRTSPPCPTYLHTGPPRTTKPGSGVNKGSLDTGPLKKLRSPWDKPPEKPPKSSSDGGKKEATASGVDLCNNLIGTGPCAPGSQTAVPSVPPPDGEDEGLRMEREILEEMIGQARRELAEPARNQGGLYGGKAVLKVVVSEMGTQTADVSTTMVDACLDCSGLMLATVTTAMNTEPVPEKTECSDQCKRTLACCKSELQKVTSEQMETEQDLALVTTKLRAAKIKNRKLESSMSSAKQQLEDARQKPPTEEKATLTELDLFEDPVRKLLRAEQKLLLKNVDLQAKLAYQLICQAYEESETIFSLKKMSLIEKARLSTQLASYHQELAVDKGTVDEWKNESERVLASGGSAESLPPFPHVDIHKFVPDVKPPAPLRHPKDSSSATSVKLAANFDSKEPTESYGREATGETAVKKTPPGDYANASGSSSHQSKVPLMSTFTPNYKSDRPGTSSAGVIARAMPSSYTENNISGAADDDMSRIRGHSDRMQYGGQPAGVTVRPVSNRGPQHMATSVSGVPGHHQTRTMEGNRAGIERRAVNDAGPQFGTSSQTRNPHQGVLASDHAILDYGFGPGAFPPQFGAPFYPHMMPMYCPPLEDPTPLFGKIGELIETFSQAAPPDFGGGDMRQFRPGPRGDYPTPRGGGVLARDPADKTVSGNDSGNLYSARETCMSSAVGPTVDHERSFGSTGAADQKQGGAHGHLGYSMMGKTQAQEGTQQAVAPPCGRRNTPSPHGMDRISPVDDLSVRRPEEDWGSSPDEEGDPLSRSLTSEHLNDAQGGQRPPTPCERRMTPSPHGMSRTAYTPEKANSESLPSRPDGDLKAHPATAHDRSIHATDYSDTTRDRGSVMTGTPYPPNPGSRVSEPCKIVEEPILVRNVEVVKVPRSYSESLRCDQSTVEVTLSVDPPAPADGPPMAAGLGHGESKEALSPGTQEVSFNKATICPPSRAVKKVKTSVRSNLGLDTFENELCKKGGRVMVGEWMRGVSAVNGDSGDDDAGNMDKWQRPGSKRKKRAGKDRVEAKPAKTTTVDGAVDTPSSVEDDLIPTVFSLPHILKKLQEMFPKESRNSLVAAILKVRAAHRGQLDNVHFNVVIAEAVTALTMAQAPPPEGDKRRGGGVACELDQEPEGRKQSSPTKPPQNTLTTLIAKLEEKFPGKHREELIRAIVQVRKTHGGTLAGKTMMEAVSEVSEYMTSLDAPKDQDKDEDKNSCSICLGSLVSVLTVRHLECEHTFHDECIQSWFQKRERTCPICRSHALLQEDFPNLNRANTQGVRRI